MYSYSIIFAPYGSKDNIVPLFNADDRSLSILANICFGTTIPEQVLETIDRAIGSGTEPFDLDTRFCSLSVGLKETSIHNKRPGSVNHATVDTIELRETIVDWIRRMHNDRM